MRQSRSAIKGIALTCSNNSNVAQVREERSGPPAQYPLDVHGGEAQCMESNTGTNPKGMGTPTLQVSSMLDRVEVVNSRGEAPHEAFDLISINELHRARTWVPIDRQWRGRGVHCRQSGLELSKALQRPVDCSNEAEAVRIGIRNVQTTQMTTRGVPSTK